MDNEGKLAEAKAHIAALQAALAEQIDQTRQAGLLKVFAGLHCVAAG